VGFGTVSAAMAQDAAASQATRRRSAFTGHIFPCLVHCCKQEEGLAQVPESPGRTQGVAEAFTVFGNSCLSLFGKAL